MKPKSNALHATLSLVFWLLALATPSVIVAQEGKPHHQDKVSPAPSTSGSTATQTPATASNPHPKCDLLFKEVTVAVTAEPDKVLLIVEENTIANPDCVCEIIKAAILASKADEELVRQIMLTALNVAPEKAKVIEICIASLSAEKYAVRRSGKGVVEVNPSGKGAKEVQMLAFSEKGVVMADPIQPPPAVTTEDYPVFPTDIRGVYLIHPAAGGFYPITQVDSTPPPTRSDPPTKPKPLSPSTFRIRR